MPGRLLAVIGTAYRATLEEQDDPVIWLGHALRGAGADVDILLRGPAVNYGVKAQDAAGLAFGERRQTQPPRLADDLASLVGKGGRVFYVEDDARARGLAREELASELRPVGAGALPGLFDEYAQVWHW